MVVKGEDNMLKNNLKRILAVKRLSYYELAKISGVNESHIGKIANGVCTDPKISTIQKLAKALDVKIDDLIEEDE